MKIRWQVVLVVAVLSVAVFFIGNRLYRDYTIYTPLEELLENDESIVKYNHSKQNDLHIIQLELEESVELYSFHTKIDLELTDVLGKDFIVKYNFEAPKKENLYNIYWKAELALQDAVNNGSYLQTMKYLDELLEEGSYFFDLKNNWTYYSWNLGDYEYSNVIYVGEEGEDGN
ncbi:hypothetical protein PRVXH_001342 [Proteinivorax hydrogeniformans]|uniref:Lipoprotein n=1 Tax=Proteinivorax hydrogeniformans TaxID=1826727 RepID=A0AAU8HPE7_9FIRM